MARRYENIAAPLMKPMMSGAEVSLTQPQQEVVGRWAIKSSLLFGLAEDVKQGRPYEGIRQRLVRMIDTDIPPEGSSVRIGRHPATDLSPAGERAWLAKILPGGPPPRIQSFGVLALAYLVIEVIIGEPVTMKTFIASTRRCDRLIRIWPARQEAISFPPPHLFTRRDMVALRETLFRSLRNGREAWHAAGPEFHF